MSLNKLVSTQSAGFDGIKVLVFGRSGMGKTRLCATVPGPLILSAEAGLLSLRQHNLPVWKINTIQDINEVYRWLTESQEPQSIGIQTVCLDSITEIAEQVLANAKTQVKDPRQAYVELITQMTDLIKKFRDLVGYNVYMSAKEERNKDEMTGVSMYGPSMPGSKMGPALPYLFDEVFQLSRAKDPQSQQDFHFLRTRADAMNDSKDRSGMLAEYETPDLGYVFSKILGQVA